MYCDLAVAQLGHPMSTSDPYFDKLMAKQEGILKSIQTEFDKHDKHREKNPDLPKYDEATSKKNEEVQDEKEKADEAIKKAVN